MGHLLGIGAEMSQRPAPARYAVSTPADTKRENSDLLLAPVPPSTARSVEHMMQMYTAQIGTVTWLARPVDRAVPPTH